MTSGDPLSTKGLSALNRDARDGGKTTQNWPNPNWDSAVETCNSREVIQTKERRHQKMHARVPRPLCSTTSLFGLSSVLADENNRPYCRTLPNAAKHGEYCLTLPATVELCLSLLYTVEVDGPPKSARTFTVYCPRPPRSSQREKAAQQGPPAQKPLARD